MFRGQRPSRGWRRARSGGSSGRTSAISWGATSTSRASSPTSPPHASPTATRWENLTNAVLDLRLTRERYLPFLRAGGVSRGRQDPPVRARGLSERRQPVWAGGGGRSALRRVQAPTRTRAHGLPGIAEGAERREGPERREGADRRQSADRRETPEN